MSRPVTILGGYLGAGKTTLVNHLLRHADGLRIAVVVNEFGALAIDSDLIEGADGNLLTLAGGCICCSFGDDLTSSLVQLAARPDIDHILIEASGVALPGAIARTLGLLAGLAHEATVVLVDAEQVRARAADPYIGDTITRQLADADLVIVNKCDLLDGAGLPDLHVWLAGAAPGAARLEATFARLDRDRVLGIDPDRLFRARAIGHSHVTASLDSATFEIVHPVDAERLADALAAPEMGLVRAKGFVRDRDGEWQTLQVVGRRFSVVAAPEGTVSPARLVAIAHGKALDLDRITRLIAACG